MKLYRKAEDLPEELRKPGSGVKFEDGWIVRGPNLRKIISLPAVLSGNCGVRAVFRRLEKTSDAGRIVLRHSADDRHYQLGLSGSTFVCQKMDRQNFLPVFVTDKLSVVPLGEPYTMEFAVWGSRLIGRYGDAVFQSVIEESLTRGTAYLGGAEDVRDIEVINLDGLSSAEALRILNVDAEGHDLRPVIRAKEKQASAMIPELVVLDEQFQKLTAERVTAPFEADVAKLNAGYLGGLERKSAEEKAAGRADGVAALEAEKKLINDKQPVPDEDDAKTTAVLKTLRGIYRAAHAKLEATRAANLKGLTDPLKTRLQQLEAEMTKKERVGDAKVVREYRERL